MQELKGTGVAIVTPFNPDLSLDLEGLSNTVNHCIEGGVDYLVVLGTTGESVTLDPSEKARVMATVKQVNRNRLPLVVGMGGNNTAKLAEEIKQADLDGFCAILSVSPYYNKPTQEGIYQHFSFISKNSPLPIILYNVPGRTSSNILPQTVKRLAADHPNIIGIKEASGDMAQVQLLVKSVPSEFLIISGDDFTALPTVLAGGVGVISVLAQSLPQAFCRMINLGTQGLDKEAYKLHHILREGMDLIFEEGNPAGIKAMLEHQNICASAVRLPLVEATQSLKERIGRYVTNLLALQA